MTTSPLSSKEHLEDHDLGLEFKELIDVFMEEVDAIGFQPAPDTSLYEICNDHRIHTAVTPLLEHLKFTKGSWGIRRVTQGGYAPFSDPTGAFYIITLRTFGNPKISGEPLQVGHSTYLKRGVSISPKVDCLLLEPQY